MRCPDCRDELVILEVDEVELDLCVAGHGTWFDAQELGQLFEAAEVSLDLETELAAVPGATGRRRCPRCHRHLTEVNWKGEGPVLDRCPQGHGLWFDPGELHALARVSMAGDQLALRQVQEYLRNFFPESTASEGSDRKVKA